MIKKLCCFPGCNEFAVFNSFCEKHKRDKTPFKNAVRYNNYNNSDWKKLRKDFMKQTEKRCAICGATEKLVVDHIIAPLGNKDLFNNKDNLMILCQVCHAKKTTMEIHARTGRGGALILHPKDRPPD